MQLANKRHLAYCTNIHRGDDWFQTMAGLESHTLDVKSLVSPDQPYAIGLRLSDSASRQLSVPATLKAFQKWLVENDCYVFTINGLPFGPFHGARIKDQVYFPDWTSPERLEYTKRLFDLLGQLVPVGIEGSVSTLPGSYKHLITSEDQKRQIRDHLWSCIDHIEQCSQRYSRTLHLGVEPEPGGLCGTTQETIQFFKEMESSRPGDTRLKTFLGVSYNTCHLAVEYEKPVDVVANLQSDGIRLSKIHLSSALQIVPDQPTREWLGRFVEERYLHQVVARSSNGNLHHYQDLDLALAQSTEEEEWRIRFQVPLYTTTMPHGRTTVDHLLGLLDLLADRRRLCLHLEIETYTWEILPPELKESLVVDQMVREYEWTLAQLKQRRMLLGVC